MTIPAVPTANDRILAFFRTYIPYAVGLAVTWLFVHTGLNLEGPVAVAAVAFLTAAVTNAYYVLVRLLEVKVPVLGIFLGWPRQPEYSDVSNLWASLVRTIIPPFVGAIVVAVSSALFLDLNPATQTDVIVVGVAVVEGIYYAAAKWLINRWPTSLGWLLGGQFSPTYPKHA